MPLPFSILHIHNIVLPIILFSNICKPEELVCGSESDTCCYDQLCSTLWTLFSWKWPFIRSFTVALAYPWDDIWLFLDSGFRAVDSGFLVSETWIPESNREGDFEGLFFIIIFLYGVIVCVYGRSCWRQ